MKWSTCSRTAHETRHCTSTHFKSRKVGNVCKKGASWVPPSNTSLYIIHSMLGENPIKLKGLGKNVLSFPGVVHPNYRRVYLWTKKGTARSSENIDPTLYQPKEPRCSMYMSAKAPFYVHVGITVAGNPCSGWCDAAFVMLYYQFMRWRDVCKGAGKYLMENMYRRQ